MTEVPRREGKHFLKSHFNDLTECITLLPVKNNTFLKNGSCFKTILLIENKLNDEFVSIQPPTFKNLPKILANCM